MDTNKYQYVCPRCKYILDHPDWRCPKCYFEFDEDMQEYAEKVSAQKFKEEKKQRFIHKKKKIKIISVFSTISILLILLIIFWEPGKRKLDEFFFNKALKKNTIVSYKKYLEKWPNGKFIYQAKKRIDELKFDIAMDSNSVAIWYDFFNKGKFDDYYSEAIKSRSLKSLEPMFAGYAKKMNNIESYENYLKNYSEGKFCKSFKIALDSCYYSKAVKDDWYSAFEEYLNKFPNGKYVKQAKSRLVWLKSRRANIKVVYPKTIWATDSPYSNVDPPFWSLDISFKEEGGDAGYKLERHGVTFYGKNYTAVDYGDFADDPAKVYVKAGGESFYSTWWAGGHDPEYKDLWNSKYVSTWYGEDSGGHKLKVEIIIEIRCDNSKF
ncbi:MAG: hypothetical protein ACE5GV_10285 [Candidatus Scalindua sp.]